MSDVWEKDSRVEDRRQEEESVARGIFFPTSDLRPPTWPGDAQPTRASRERAAGRGLRGEIMGIEAAEREVRAGVGQAGQGLARKISLGPGIF